MAKITSLINPWNQQSDSQKLQLITDIQARRLIRTASKKKKTTVPITAQKYNRVQAALRQLSPHEAKLILRSISCP